MLLAVLAWGEFMALWFALIALIWIPILLITLLRAPFWWYYARRGHPVAAERWFNFREAAIKVAFWTTATLLFILFLILGFRGGGGRIPYTEY